MNRGRPGCAAGSGPPGTCASRRGRCPRRAGTTSGPGDQPVRLDGPHAAAAIVCPVVEPQPLVVAAGAGQRGQYGWVHRGRRRVGRDRHGVVRHRADPAAQPGRQHVLQLGQGAYRGLLDAGDRAARGGAQPDGDGYRLIVVEQQRWHGRPGTQPVPAVGAPAGVHRVAKVAQPADVPPHGAFGDLQPGSQVGTGPVPAGLQQRQQFQQPGRGLPHEQKSASPLGQKLSGTVRSVAGMRTSAQIEPFRIDIPQRDLDDLAARLSAIRWPDELTGPAPTTACRWAWSSG